MNRKLLLIIPLLVILVAGSISPIMAYTSESILVSKTDNAGLTITCQNGQTYQNGGIKLAFSEIPLDKIQSTFFKNMFDYTNLEFPNIDTIYFAIIGGVINDDNTFKLKALIINQHPCSSYNTAATEPKVPQNSPFIIDGICTSVTGGEAPIKRINILNFTGVNWTATNTSTTNYPEIGCITILNNLQLVDPE